MNHLQLYIVILIAVTLDVAYCKTVTPAEQCRGEHFDDLRQRIQVIPCGARQCRLQQGTNVTVIFKFKPKAEVKTLTNNVYATIANLPLPFLGVDGVDACPQVTRTADGAPAPCPLKADQEYTYTNVFYIERFYPLVQSQVHWSLQDQGRDVICFEVPAVITAAKKKN